MTTHTADYVVTPDSEATAGAISYWRLSGSLALSRLEVAWKAAGLDLALLPSSPEPEVALRRAVAAQQARRRLVRPLAKRGAWVIKDEAVASDGTDTTYETVARVFFDGGVTFPARIERVEAPDVVFDTVAEGIRAAYYQHRSELQPEDVSVWLVKLAKGQSAVSLRDAGGIYFVPRPAVEFWRQVAGALQAAAEGHHVFRIPALRNDEAIDAILDAITVEAEAEAAAIEADLTAEGDQALGERALATRTKRCAQVLAKVSSYEGLLGVKLETIRERVERLQADVSAASLLAGSIVDAAA
jgi:hypothetical protein